MIAVAILAAGESRRMGSPKALIDFRGKTFTEHLIEATRTPRVGYLRVVLGSKYDEIRPRLPVCDDSIVNNESWPRGQLSSIWAAIRKLPLNGTSGLMLCPVDHPLVSAKTIAALLDGFEALPRNIVLPTFEGRRGHPVIFPARLYNELLQASPDVGARQVVWKHKDEVTEIITDDEGVVLNLDDPEAYRKAVETFVMRTPPAAPVKVSKARRSRRSKGR
jgi:molybdenum cofactor cytidylyltransferase